MPTVSARIRAGLTWHVSGLVIGRGTSILVRLLLAGVLLPEHFGWVAMITILLAACTSMVDLGLQQVLVQRPRDGSTRLLHDSAAWLVLASGLVWFAALAAAGVPALAWLFDEDLLRAPALVMSIGVITSALGLFPTLELSRRMRFGSIAAAEVAGVLAGAVVAVVLAYAGAGVWSLAIQPVLAGVVTTLVLWRRCRGRPRLRCDLRALARLRASSAAVLGSRAVQLVRTQLDKLLIGFTLGAGALGIYSFAYMLAEGLRLQVASITGRVLLPAFSRMQDDPVTMGTHYLAALRMWTVTVLPVFLGIWLFARPLMQLGLEPAWWPATTPLQILALGGVAFAWSGPCAEVLQASGRHGLLLRITLSNLVFVAVPATWWMTMHLGLPGAAAAFTLAFTAQRLALAWVAMRLMGLPWTRLCRAIAPSVSVAATLGLGQLVSGPFVPVPVQACIFAISFVWLAFRNRSTPTQAP